MRERVFDHVVLFTAALLLIAVSVYFSRSTDAPDARDPTHTIGGDGLAFVNGATYIDVNTADVDLLMSLPGIGEVYATRIVQYREQNGPFASLSALDDVKGIGPKTVEALAAFAVAGAANTN